MIMDCGEGLLQMNPSNQRKKYGTCILSSCELCKAKGKVTLRWSCFNLLVIAKQRRENSVTLIAKRLFRERFQLLFCATVLVHVTWCDQKWFCPETFPVQAAWDWFFLIAQASWSLMLKMKLHKPHSAEFCCELWTVDMYFLRSFCLCVGKSSVG